MVFPLRPSLIRLFPYVLHIFSMTFPWFFPVKPSHHITPRLGPKEAPSSCTVSRGKTSTVILADNHPPNMDYLWIIHLDSIWIIHGCLWITNIYIYICIIIYYICIYVTYGHLFKCGISPSMHYINGSFLRHRGILILIIHFSLGLPFAMPGCTSQVNPI